MSKIHLNEITCTTPLVYTLNNNFYLISHSKFNFYNFMYENTPKNILLQNIKLKMYVVI